LSSCQISYVTFKHGDGVTDPSFVQWASIVIYNLALFLTKFSILLQYLRIFPYRLFRILCLSLMAFIFAWSCWTVIGAIFFCTPVAFFWDKSIKGGTCLSKWTVW
jgi:hypothetical protein